MSQIAAIFDLDDTLLAGSSGPLIIAYLRRTHQLRRFFRMRHLLAMGHAVVRYRLGLADTTRTMQQVVRCGAGIAVPDIWEVVDAWFATVLERAIRPQAVARLAWHAQQNHIPIICSASSQFSVVPVARHLEIEHYFCSEWLIDGDRLTGEIRLPIPYGPGKCYWIEEWAAEHEVDLAQSYFYTDHVSDLPLLECVGHPVAVNPERRLRATAQARKWPIENW